jgi:hypothetical protein
MAGRSTLGGRRAPPGRAVDPGRSSAVPSRSDPTGNVRKVVDRRSGVVKATPTIHTSPCKSRRHEGESVKRLLVISLAVAAVAAPAASAADPTPADFKNAAKYCKAVRESKGLEAFRAQYGTNASKANAFGKCVSKTADARAGAREDAAEAKATAACKKQRSDDAAKFAQTYKNLGQCVKAQKGETT